MTLIDRQELNLEADLPGYPDLVKSLACWQAWRADAPAPSWTSVNMIDLPARLIRSTIVVDVIDAGRDLRFRFWGSALVELYDAELTGKLFSEVSDKLFGGLPHAQYQQAIDTIVPSLFRVSIRRPNDIIANRLNLRLPIAGDDGTVDKVMTVVEIQELQAPTGGRLDGQQSTGIH